MSQCITYEQLAEVLDKMGIWKFVSGYQKVDFNCRFAVVVESTKYRDLLVERGLNINGVHVSFGYHKRRVIRIRVHLATPHWYLFEKDRRCLLWSIMVKF